MSSRRDLKKNINKTVELLYIDCFFYQMFVVDANKDAADKVLERIAHLHTDFISRVNVNEGKDVKGRVRQYYKKLIVDLKAQVDEIGKEIAALP